MKRKGYLGVVSSILILLLFGSLAYLVLLRGWGYYKDDWHLIWAGNALGLSGIIQLFTLDRPFMGVLYAITYRLLGESTLAWQVFGFLVRFCSALFFYWLVSAIWQKRSRLTLIMACIFLIYPGFLQQPNANTFQNHFIGLAAAILSIVFTIKSFQTKKYAWKLFFILASVFLTLFYLLIYEYMIGLEIVRFLLVDFTLQQKEALPVKKRLLRLFLGIIPYLIVLVVFLLWRFVIFNSTRAATDPGLIGAMYLSQPLPMLMRLILESLKDIFAVMISAWVVPLYQLSENLDYPSLLLAILIGAAGIAAWMLYTRKDVTSTKDGEYQSKHETLFLFVFGTLLASITLLPIILMNRDIHFSDQFDRYSLQASIGVAIAAGGLLSGIKNDVLQRWITASILGISLITHVCNGIYYTRFWSAQQQLWWQLSWRAPGVRRNTTLVALMPSGFGLAEGYEIWGPANRIYYPAEKDIILSGETMNQETLGWIQSKQSYGRVFRTFTYTVDFKNSLILSLPGNGSCLHVLGGDQLELSGNEGAVARLLAPISQPDLIDMDVNAAAPPEKIFGKEPAHEWCYYFQKISLERQRQNWPAAVELANDALSLNLQPVDNSEWMPLYVSYYQVGDMERTNEIGGILRASPEFIAPYCAQFTDEMVDNISADKDLSFLVFNICPYIVNE